MPIFMLRSCLRKKRSSTAHKTPQGSVGVFMVRHLITVQLSLLQTLFVYIFIHFTVYLVCFSFLGGGGLVLGCLFGGI